MSTHVRPQIVTNGLIYLIDAANTKSYSGTGSVINNLAKSGETAFNYGIYDAINKQFNFTEGASSYIRTDQTVTGIKSVAMLLYIPSTVVAGTGGWKYMIDANNRTVGGALLYFTAYNPNNTSAAGGGIGSDWELTMYANGVQVATTWNNIPKDQWVYLYLQTKTGITRDNLLTFMARYAGDESAGGKLKLVHVYNRDLTQAEIIQNMNASKGRY